MYDFIGCVQMTEKTSLRKLVWYQLSTKFLRWQGGGAADGVSLCFHAPLATVVPLHLR